MARPLRGSLLFLGLGPLPGGHCSLPLPSLILTLELLHGSDTHGPGTVRPSTRRASEPLVWGSGVEGQLTEGDARPWEQVRVRCCVLTVSPPGPRPFCPPSVSCLRLRPRDDGTLPPLCVRLLGTSCVQVLGCWLESSRGPRPPPFGLLVAGPGREALLSLACGQRLSPSSVWSFLMSQRGIGVGGPFQPCTRCVCI